MENTISPPRQGEQTREREGRAVRILFWKVNLVLGCLCAGMFCHSRSAGKIGGNGERVLLTPRILHELVFHEVKRKSGEQGERRYNGGNNPAPRGIQPMGIER